MAEALGARRVRVSGRGNGSSAVGGTEGELVSGVRRAWRAWRVSEVGGARWSWIWMWRLRVGRRRSWFCMVG